MWYIVYQNRYKGYYVGWQNKGADKYSKNPIEAKKYLSIAPALTRLGFNINTNNGDYLLSREDFIKILSKSKKSKRNTILSEILSEPVSLSDLIFSNGRIDKIDENGRIIGLADKEVLEFIDSYIEKNKRTKEKELAKYNKLARQESLYVNLMELTY